jgi:site-specific DNA-methyltransferase (adenine-specific)
VSKPEPSRRVALVPLAELKHAARNPKRHDVAYLAGAIGAPDTGLVDLPIIDERTGLLLAGHGRLKALEALFEKDPAHPPKGAMRDESTTGGGRWLVEVVRGWSSRDDAHADAVLVALNRAPERGGWDLGELGALLRDLPENALDLSGFSLDDVDDAIAKAKTTPRNLSDESTVPSGSAVKVRQLDVWALGEHVLACGESPHVLKGLIGARKPKALVTDPPYGINIVGGDRAVGGGGLTTAGRYAPVRNDDKPFDPRPYLEIAPRTVLFGANHYADKLPSSPAWLVWDKRDGLESNDFADVELAWSNLKGPARLFRHRWSGMLKASEKGTRRQHPTQKPVALFEWVLELATKRGDLVVDPFVGSGSTVLAGETKGRPVIAAELEAAYCQVTIDRWEKLTGKRATLLDRARTRKGRK